MSVKAAAPPAATVCSFNLIYSFDHLDQVILDLETATGITEAAFVGLALAELTDAELAQLIKISLCQNGVTATTAEPWVVPRNGKFFFNDGHNPDPDTRHWAAVKAEALKARFQNQK